MPTLSNYLWLLDRVTRTELALALGRPVIPYKLELFLTYRCNARCGTCSIQRLARGDDYHELSPERIARAIGSISSRLAWLSFTGGEPTLREDLSDIFRAVYGARGSIFMVNMSTNGLLPARLASLAETIATDCPDWEVWISVSLDGAGAAHDTARGVPGAFDKLSESIAILADAARANPRLAVSVQSTVHEHTSAEVDALVATARKLLPHASPIFTLSTPGHLLTGGQPSVDARRRIETMGDVVDAIRRGTTIEQLPDLLPYAYTRLLERYVATGKAPVPCRGGIASWTITPTGEVRACDFLAEPLGHLGDTDDDLDRLARSTSFRERQRANATCRRCFTPCQAYPAIYHSPLATLSALVGELVRGGSRR